MIKLTPEKPPYYEQEGSGTTKGALIKQYIALLTQVGTAAPTATIIQNTTGGTVTWTRSDVGQYPATTTFNTPIEKTAFTITQSAGNRLMVIANIDDTITVTITAADNGVAQDDALLNTLVTITIYP